MSDKQRGAQRALVLIAAGLFATAAQAQEGLIQPGNEYFKLNLGGVLTTNNANIRIDGTTRTGTDFDLEGVTGLKDSASTFFAQGTWRFLPRHRIGVTYFGIDRDRTVAIDREITIGDTVIPINTSLKTEAKTQFFITNYMYSFIKNEDLELAGIFGLYGANYKYKFTASSPIINIDKSTTAPLPVLGLAADFYLSPRWTVSVFGEGLKVKVGDVDGSMYSAGISTDYMITRTWGVGLGYQVADVKVDSTKSDFNGHLSWRMDGYFAYLQARF